MEVILIIVSILVLLDVALKGYLAGDDHRGSNLVSILVLLDVALKVAIDSRNEIIQGRFNPCSLGCCSESRVYRV